MEKSKVLFEKQWRMGAKMKPNRRKFIDHNGRIIETDFDVYWCAIDKNGERWVYDECPHDRFLTVWYGHILLRKKIDNITPPKNWRKCRWYLQENGKWVKR